MTEQGTYLMDRIRARCVEEGECLIWQGAMSKSIPRVWHNGESVNARVAIWRDMGKRVPANTTIKPKCGDDLCVSPKCLEVVQHLKYPKSPTHKAAIAKAMRARSSFNMEICEEIRRSDETRAVLAERHGVHKSTIDDIRKFNNWKPLSCPFNGLGART